MTDYVEYYLELAKGAETTEERDSYIRAAKEMLSMQNSDAIMQERAETTKASRKISGKDILSAVPTVLTALAGIAGTVYSVKAQREMARENNQARMDIARLMVKENEDDVIVDKPIKVTNEIFR